MSHRKRTSKRRWKARFANGKWITMEAVINHRLDAYLLNCERHSFNFTIRRAA